MNPVYLMQALGLDTPELEAIREGLPVYQALRQLVTFFVNNGFSLVETNSMMGFETLVLRMQTKVESRVTLQYHTEGNYLTCTFETDVRGGWCSYAYSLGEKASLRATTALFGVLGSSFSIYDRNLPFNLALEMYKNRVMEQLYPDINLE